MPWVQLPHCKPKREFLATVPHQGPRRFWRRSWTRRALREGCNRNAANSRAARAESRRRRETCALSPDRYCDVTTKRMPPRRAQRQDAFPRLSYRTSQRGLRPPPREMARNASGASAWVVRTRRRKLPLQQLLGCAAADILPHCLPLSPKLPEVPEPVPTSD
jgi:hypothetical protein